MWIAPSLRVGLAVIASVAMGLSLGPEPTRLRQVAEPAPALVASPHNFEFRTESDAALMEWALGRFHQAGLELPPLIVAFHDAKEPCGGHPGVYRSGTPARVDICGFNWDRFIVKARMTLLHELGHAWAAHTLSAEARQEFVDSRGLPTWGDDQWPWKEQGSEQTAEIIAWALLDQDQGMSSIPDARPLALADAYLRLTGTMPTLRIAGILSRLSYSL